jgi:hypothetical protein
LAFNSRCSLTVMVMWRCMCSTACLDLYSTLTCTPLPWLVL